MTIAVMDLGTNTFQLLIAERSDNKLRIIYQAKVGVKLSQDGITSGFISELPFKRGIRAMKKFKKKITEFNVDAIYATGTAAIRSAKNNRHFLNEIKKETGIGVHCINGLKEAELIYEGVRQAVPLGLKRWLIMDIGGGSVEFIIAGGKKIYWKHSFNIGGALLLEKFKPSDPISIVQLKKINSFLNRELKPLFDASSKFKPEGLIGSEGPFDSFAQMIACEFYTPGILKNKTSWEFKMSDYRFIHNKLLYSSSAERKKMKGLIAIRIDMIVIASILLTFVLNKLKLSKMNLSAFALKEGVMFRLLNNEPV